MSTDINILVNGNRCKQYHHNGKIFVEAKEGSEYAIEIKNNEWKRILAVCSVDGLDILNGKAAEEDGPGYVISAYNNSRFDGFRVSDDKVAKFLFDYKASSYAASKGDGAEKNVGVIGIRIFNEKEKPIPTIIREEHNHYYPRKYPYDGTPVNPWRPWPMWCDATWSSSTLGNALQGIQPDITYGCCNNVNDVNEWIDNEPERSSDKENYSADLSRGIKSKGLAGNPKVRWMNASCNNTSLSENNVLRGFDMGTKWGEAKESKVIEVEFERGVLALTTNIYYASRQSLIEMGVPLGTEKQVSFPEPFADAKYAKPPKNWKG